MRILFNFLTPILVLFIQDEMANFKANNKKKEHS